MAPKSSSKPEIWGGLECSFNRVKDLYLDQLQFSGHYSRIREDIARIASLGISALRYPVIWERLHAFPGQPVDWESTLDIPLNTLRAHGITPIAGLVHHGSGPPHADLLRPDFARELSQFAASVAERFPWINCYTPVNEPLTTARFTCLYGHWYPHRRSDHAFCEALINQVRAIVMSMREIRKVNPAATLIQTEDLAKVYSTPRLKYQADFENHRRWLTVDLLCGMVDRHHPLWDYFIRSGVREEALYFFVDNPCPPDIVGADYYATSERYLDEDLDKYPRHTHGGNHFERYADVEAFRVRHGQPAGISLLLKECWERYGIPIAVTEVHINCDVDHQIRWFAEIRNNCRQLVQDGVDIRAVTAWALLGAFGWNTLLTRGWGDYECGAFDIRSGIPRSTPLADYLASLSADPEFVHPAERECGWWHADDRFLFEAEEITASGGATEGYC